MEFPAVAWQLWDLGREFQKNSKLCYEEMVQEWTALVRDTSQKWKMETLNFGEAGWKLQLVTDIDKLIQEGDFSKVNDFFEYVADEGVAKKVRRTM